MFDCYSFYTTLDNYIFAPMSYLTGIWGETSFVSLAVVVTCVFYILIHIFIFKCILAFFKYIWRVI